MMFIWIIGLGFLIYYLMKDDKNLFTHKNQSKTILDNRLARGEITTNEYLSILNTMKEE